VQNTEKVIAFHRKALSALLTLAQHEGLATPADVNAVKARILFNQPLWQILEAEGKYGGPYISEGVKETERFLGRRVNRRSGSWPERVLIGHRGSRVDGRRWRDQPEYRCNLDHVIEAKHLLREILERPAEAIDLLDRGLLGCVVLHCEHIRLPVASASIAIRDPWWRYRRAGIKVWSRKENAWISQGFDNPVDGNAST
jgi:hypothetical protein